MKSFATLSLALSLLIFSCTKNTESDGHPAGLPVSAETKSINDNTNYGIYKGVVLGSSGIIILKVNNEENFIKGYLTIDNKKDTLSTIQTIAKGQTISNLLFTGKFSSMKLTANGDGSNAQISDLEITGHPGATAIIFHENSNQQILLYEGTISGELTGRINFIKKGTDNGSSDVEYLAKISSDNYYMRGIGQPDSDTGSRKLTHYMFDIGGFDRGLTGYLSFDLSKVTGEYNSYVHQELRSYRGTINCKRTY